VNKTNKLINDLLYKQMLFMPIITLPHFQNTNLLRAIVRETHDGTQ